MSRVLSEIIRPGRVGLGSQVTVPVYTSRGYNAGDYVYLHPDGTVGSKGTYGYLGEDLTYCGWDKKSTGKSAQSAESVSYGPMQDYGTYTGTTVTEGAVVTNNVALNAEAVKNWRTCVLTNGNLVVLYNPSATTSTLKFIISTSSGSSVVAATTVTTSIRTTTFGAASPAPICSFDVITIPDVGFLVAWSDSSVQGIYWRLYDDSGTVLEEFASNATYLSYYFPNTPFAVRMANLSGTDVLIVGGPVNSGTTNMSIAVWGRSNRADGISMRLGPTNNKYGYLTIGATPSNGARNDLIDMVVTTFPNQHSGHSMAAIMQKTAAGAQYLMCFMVNKARFATLSFSNSPNPLVGGVTNSWVSYGITGSPYDIGTAMVPMPFPNGSSFVANATQTTAVYSVFPRRDIYGGNPGPVSATLVNESTSNLGGNNSRNYSKNFAVHPMFNNFMVYSGAGNYVTYSSGNNMAIGKYPLSASTSSNSTLYKWLLLDQFQDSTPLNGFMTDLSTTNSVINNQTPSLNVFRDRLYGLVYQNASNYLYLSTVSNLTATNGSTLLYGKRYSPDYGYYLLGVAVTSAAAGATGQVIINGEATLNSSYPSVSNSLSFSYDTGGYGTLGQRGRVSGRNVTLQGVEE